jgi:hypothetical protein
LTAATTSPRSLPEPGRRLLSLDVAGNKGLTFLEGGWAVEWRTYSASYLDSPGGEAKEVRGTVLMVLKKLPDDSWKCFRAMGAMEPSTPGTAGGL